jgi:hypothetical protein
VDKETNPKPKGESVTMIIYGTISDEKGELVPIHWDSWTPDIAWDKDGNLINRSPDTSEYLNRKPDDPVVLTTGQLILITFVIIIWSLLATLILPLIIIAALASWVYSLMSTFAKKMQQRLLL